MPLEDDQNIQLILREAKVIAVVGASKKPWRDSYRIANFLRECGYTVFPVNPLYSDIEGVRCFPSVQSIGTAVDIVDVFRNPDAADEAARDAIASHAKVLWLQLGVINPMAATRAEAAGMKVIMDRCIAVEYSRLMRSNIREKS